MEQSKIYISDVYNQANAVTIKTSLSMCTLVLKGMDVFAYWFGARGL
jgi:hypothetical protein